MKILPLIVYLLAMTSPAHGGFFDESVNSTLLKLSKQLNKTLPIRVGKTKTLESTAVVKDVLLYTYRVTDDSTFRDSRFDINKYTYFFRNSVGESVCKDPSSFALLKRGASYNYFFVNDYGQSLFDYTLNEKECTAYLNDK